MCIRDSVVSTERGPRVMISRTHPGLVKRLFELEVPEIFDGTVEVKAISREAGARTKMAVWSKDPNVNPVSACIGEHGDVYKRQIDIRPESGYYGEDEEPKKDATDAE